MRRPFLLLVLGLACSGTGDLPPEACDQPLPPSDDSGIPWPSFAAASAKPIDCEGDLTTARQWGTCSDGKRFVDIRARFTGSTSYYMGEALVGVRRAAMGIVSCDEYNFGDTDCEVIGEQDICP